MRKEILVCLAAALMLPAQERRQYEAYTYDGSGNRYGGRVYGEVRTPGQVSKTERVISVNGRAVPVEEIQEKVLKDIPGHRVVERIVRRYSQDGRPASVEKIRIEERRDPSGKRTTVATVYEGDLNGRFRVRERQVTEAVKRGETTEAVTVVERPSVSGSMQVVERRQVRELEKQNGLSREVMIYRPAGGRFVPAAREVTEIVREGNRETAVTTQYNNVTADGRMGFAGKTVKEIVRRPDGSQRQVINIYGTAAPGRPVTGSGGEQLREQILVESQVLPDGSVVERTGVRRVSLSDPNRLEAYQPVSEVICRGNCLPPAPEPQAEEAAEKGREPAEVAQDEGAEQAAENAERSVVIRDVVPGPGTQPQQPGTAPGREQLQQPQPGAAPAGEQEPQEEESGPEVMPATDEGAQPTEGPQGASRPRRDRGPGHENRPRPDRGPGSDD